MDPLEAILALLIVAVCLLAIRMGWADGSKN